MKSFIPTPGRSMAAVVLIASMLAGAPALAASASSSAYDAEANISALGLPLITFGPINPVGGTAPPSYNLANSVASYSFSTDLSGVGLPLDTLSITSGILNSSASSSYPTPPSATAAASIANLDVLLSAPAGVTLLNLTADLIASSSTADSGMASGTANLVNATLSGTLVGGTISLPPSPPPNDVIYDLGGLEIVLNEQTPIDSDGIMTNAVDIIFSSFPLGTGVLSGNIILSHSQAEAPAVVGMVPEPATWAFMLAGAGLMGAALRRKAAKAA